MGALPVRGEMPAVEAREGDGPFIAALESGDDPWSRIRRDQV